MLAEVMDEPAVFGRALGELTMSRHRTYPMTSVMAKLPLSLNQSVTPGSKAGSSQS